MTPDVPRDPLANAEWSHPEPSARVAAAIRNECTTDLAPVKRKNGRTRAILAFAVSAVIVGSIAWLRRDMSRPDGAFRAALLGAVGWGLVQLLVLGLGLARAPGRRASRSWRIAAALLIPAIFAVYLFLDSTRMLSMQHLLQTEGIMRCTVWSLVFGSVVAGTVLTLWRRTDPFDPGISGALAGLVGGLTGAVTVGVACPNFEAWHLCIGHTLGLVVLGVAGWLIGRRWLAP